MGGGLGGVERDLLGPHRSGLFLNQLHQARTDAAPLQRGIDCELAEMGNLGTLQPGRSSRKLGPVEYDGSDEATLIETITNGRAGVMPAWVGRLDPSTIKALTVFVHSLGGGK